MTTDFSFPERLCRAWQALSGRDVSGYLTSKRRDHERGLCRGPRVCVYCANERANALDHQAACVPELVDYLKRLVRFCQDAPRCDFKEDRTLSWLNYTTAEAQRVIDKAETSA